MLASLAALSARFDDGSVRVVVESPRGAALKLKYEPELTTFAVVRPLPLGLSYPFDWGFVPGTRAEDGDPVDALVLWDVATFPGVVIPCRAVAVLELEQDKKDAPGKRERNDRLIVVPTAAARAQELRDQSDLEPRLRAELELFFLDAIFFEPKHPRIIGWRGARQADALIDAARI